MRVNSAILASLCNLHGPSLKLPAGLDGARILWALAGNESTFGRDCGPTHESGYCIGGKYYDRTLTEMWGCLAHMSYGPWQVMYPNISPDGSLSPLFAARDYEGSLKAAVRLLNGRILGVQQAATLEQIADAYNSGDWRDRNVPERYIADFARRYALPVGSLG